MKNIASFQSEKIKFLLTDIDDTMTDQGRLGPDSYQALWRMSQCGIKILPITGRPAGWCEMIARFWPIAGVVGENGGFYFSYQQNKMKRYFALDNETMRVNKNRLEIIKNEILTSVPGCDLASDQFCRLMDLAIDFCEDVSPLPMSAVDHIVNIFKKHGAQAKISSIHVNGWFGEYNKLSTTLTLLQNEFGLSPAEAKSQCAFVGDSPNDEPMFEFFPSSFAVANIKDFSSRLVQQPAFVTNHRSGSGFVEVADKLIASFKPAAS